MVEMNACVAANMDVEKWLTGQYPRWIMEHVTAWHNLSILVAAHIEDAKAREMRKKSKGKK